jgi:hypothetical protein
MFHHQKACKKVLVGVKMINNLRILFGWKLFHLIIKKILFKSGCFYFESSANAEHKIICTHTHTCMYLEATIMYLFHYKRTT